MIFLALLTMFLLVIAYHNEKLYYPMLYTLIFLYLIFGTYVIRYSFQFPLFGNVTVFELLFIPLIIAGLLGKSANYRQLKNIPTKNILVVFLLFYIVLTIRNVSSVDLFASQMSYIRTFPFVFTMMLVLSVPNPAATVNRLFSIVVLSAFIISVVSLFIYLTGISLPGLNIRSYEMEKRIIWGTVGVLNLAILFILAFDRFAPRKYKLFYSIVVLLSLIAIINTQGRAQLLMLIITILSWITFKKRANKIVLFTYFVCLAGAVYFFISNELKILFFNRFVSLEKEINIIPVLTDSRLLFDDLGRWGPLIMSLRSNTNLFNILFGHGYDPGYLSTSTHLHSGFGYVYSSMGIVGVIIVYGLIIFTIKKYREFLKITEIDCFEKEIMRITIHYITVVTIFSLSIGNLVQGYLIMWGLQFGLLELCRRSILIKYYRKSNVLV